MPHLTIEYSANLDGQLDMARGSTAQSRREYEALLAKDPKNVPVMPNST